MTYVIMVALTVYMSELALVWLLGYNIDKIPISQEVSW